MPSVTLLEGRGVRPLVFRPIPAGEFVMGSRGWHRVDDRHTNEEPAHHVVIPRWLGHGSGGFRDLEGIAYWMAEVPVTQGQFDLWKADSGPGGYGAWYLANKDRLGLVGSHSHYFHDPDRYCNRVHHPVENIDIREAQAFRDWLAQEGEFELVVKTTIAEVGARSGLEFRLSLPSEALWEYACRAGTDTDFWSGDGERALMEVGYCGEPFDGGSTHPVAERPANPWGLFDMHGNVWEWCLDPWDPCAYRRWVTGGPLIVPEAYGRDLDPSVPRVVRGGSWIRDSGWCRSAFRDGRSPWDRSRSRGFRLSLIPSLEAVSRGVGN